MALPTARILLSHRRSGRLARKALFLCGQVDDVSDARGRAVEVVASVTSGNTTACRWLKPEPAVAARCCLRGPPERCLLLLDFSLRFLSLSTTLRTLEGTRDVLGAIGSARGGDAAGTFRP